MKLAAPIDDRGSLLMAMLVVTVGLGLSAVMAPVVVRQITATRTLVARTDELDAAQAGLDVMMARVRAASDAKLNGLLEDLPPCSLTGDAAVGGTDETLGYRVTIVYRDKNGTAMTSCPPTDVPVTATVTAVGIGAGGGVRSLSATYVFTTDNSTIPGGPIKIDTSTAGNLCLDSGATRPPPTGAKVTMQICDGSSRQQFGYTADLYLKLINTEMCLDAGASHADQNYVTFQPCPSTRTSRYQWALDGAGRFVSTSPTSGNTDNFCMTVQTTGSVGSAVIVSSAATSGATRNTACYPYGYANASLNVWRSGAGVGAGMAGDATNQLVNYAQFSRCFDVTSQDPNSSFMIAWFCKQSPTGNVDWNQQWTHPTPTLPATYLEGNITVTKGSTTYCLKTPASSSSSVGTAYPTVVQCTTAIRADDKYKWTVFHDTGDYATSYVIKDKYGFCLTPTDPPDINSDGTSKIKIAPCTSSEMQKWNAPPNLKKPTPLTDLTEK